MDKEMDINNLQRTPSYSYRVDADKIKQRFQQTDKNRTAEQRQGDSVGISEEGRSALREKMSAIGRSGLSEDIGKLPAINSGIYGMMNDFSTYETHSRFMATNTQIWSELQGFKAQIVYHSGGAETEPLGAKNESAGVKEQAYNAFMAAINEKNVGISSSARNVLNSVWDYYASLKH